MEKVAIAELGIDTSGISKAVISVVKELQDKGFTAYLVGGAVRDLLLGYAPKDFDVATNARPEQIKRIFRRAWIIGKRFRIVHVRIKNQLIEVTTFRKKPKPSKSNRQGMIQHDNVFGSIQEDAYRRDITMNALFLDPTAKCVIDYTGGLADIKKRQLRIIGKPALRYQEDPVRMIRILRLAGKLDCSIDKASLAPIAKQAHLLEQIVQARLLEEIIKVIFSKAACECFELLNQHGITKYLFPHMRYLTTEEQNNFWQTALSNTDRLNRANKRVSLSYVVSALFWPVIAQKWQEHIRHGRPNMDTMYELFIQSGIEDNPILSRIIRSKVLEIFEYQVRFENYYNRRKALSIHTGYSLDKALNFLRLRNETDEIPEEIPLWWEEFVAADKQTRQTLVPPKRKRRSKRKATKSDDA